MENRKKGIYKVTIVGTLGNLLLLVFKLVAGILGRSAAMIADAVHSLSDFATDLVVLIFVKLSSKPRDDTHDYGHGKYETLATAIIAICLFGVGVGIMWESGWEIHRFCQGEELARPGWIALVAAVVSIVVKEALYQYTMIKARHLKSNVMKANAWHHRSDALSSIGATLGITGAIFLGVKGRVLDPIAAMVVSVFIIWVAWKLVKPSIDELLERSLPPEEEKRIEDIIAATPGVLGFHNLRTRRIGNYAAIDIHVKMDPLMTVEESHAITRTIEQQLRSALGQGTIISIHVEPYHPFSAR